MEKPSGLSVIQGLHLYLVEARVGQCDSTHIAFCKCHPSMNPKEKSNVCVTLILLVLVLLLQEVLPTTSTNISNCSRIQLGI